MLNRESFSNVRPKSLLAWKGWDEIIVAVQGVGRVLDSCSQKCKFSPSRRWQRLAETGEGGGLNQLTAYT